MILRISWRQTGRVDPLRRRGGHRRACSVQTWQLGMQPGRCADLFGAVTMAQWGRTVPAQWGPTQRRRPRASSILPARFRATGWARTSNNLVQGSLSALSRREAERRSPWNPLRRAQAPTGKRATFAHPQKVRT